MTYTPHVWSRHDKLDHNALNNLENAVGDFSVAQLSASDSTIAPIIQSGPQTQAALRARETVYLPEDYGAKGDGTTDDTAAIQSASDALNSAGGGRLKFAVGKTYIVSGINAAANVEYYGFGATVKCSSNATLGPFVANGVGANSQIRGFRIDANGLGQRGAYIGGVSGVTFEYNYVFNFGLTNAKEGVRLAPSSSSCVVRRNTVIGPVDSPHGTVTQGFEGVMVISTTPDTYGGGNNATLTFGSATNVSTSHSITENRLENGLHGITLIGAQLCDVSGNWCINGSERGIIMSPIAMGNIIRGNHCTGVVSTGIHMAWGCTFNTIEGNYIDCTGTSAIEKTGIKGYYGCNDNIIRGNVVRGALDYAYGVLFGSARNIFEGNRADNCKTGVQIMGVSTTTNNSTVAYTAFPAQLPNADSNVVRGNTFNNCTNGVLIDACGTNITAGYGNTTNTAVGGNTAIACTNPYLIQEWTGATVTGISATDNAATATVSNGPAWVMPRGERHFVHKASNAGLINTPSGWMQTGKGMWYAAPVAGSLTTASTALGEAVARCASFFVPNTVALASVGCEVVTAGTAGAVVRLGIFADNGMGAPGVLVLDAGTIDGTVVSAAATIAVNQQLTPGTYWMVAVIQGGAATVPTLRAVASSAGQSATTLPLGTTTPGAAAAATYGWTQSGISGSLPASFTTSPGLTAVVPRVIVKVS